MARQRARRIKPADDEPPRCPGCSRALSFSQPDELDSERIMGCCLNADCRQWTTFARVEGRWRVVERIMVPPGSPAPAAAAP